MNRRQFLLTTSAVIPSFANGQTQSDVLSVADFGADPTGKDDSTAAIGKAAGALRTRRARKLVFPQGTYRLTTVQRMAMDLSGLSNVEIDGNQSTLILGQDARCMTISNATGVNVHDLTVDWNPLPFTQGTVTSVGPTWLVIKVDEGFPAPSNMAVLALNAYDRSTKTPSKERLEIYGPFTTAQQSSPGELRLDLNRPVVVRVGTTVVVRFKQGHEAFSITDSSAITFERVHLNSSYSLGYNISSARDMRFAGITIAPPANSLRLLSTNADGMHITNCTGSLVIEGCSFAAMGDDAININSGILKLNTTAGDRRPQMLTRSGASVLAKQAPAAGHDLEILDSHDLHVIGEAKAAVAADGTARAAVVESSSPKVAPETLVVDRDGVPATQIANCQFNGNRARAIVAHSNLQVRNCVFKNTTGPAILLAPDLVWLEGPATRDVIIDTNRFSGCHYLTNDPEGSITIDVMHTYSRRFAVPGGEAKHVQVLRNTFDSCPTAAISCRSADQLVIQGNHVGATWTNKPEEKTAGAIILSLLSNSQVTENSASVPSVISASQCTSTTINDNPGFHTA